MTSTIVAKSLKEKSHRTTALGEEVRDALFHLQVHVEDILALSKGSVTCPVNKIPHLVGGERSSLVDEGGRCYKCLAGVPEEVGKLRR